MRNILVLALILSLLTIGIVDARTCNETLPGYIQDLPGLTAEAAVNAPCMYSGFASIDADKNMFYWFIQHTNTNRTTPAPVLVWLNGGPGSSSLVGLFTELGPLRITRNATASTGFDINVLLEDVWTVNNDVIFIDNPLGTGFSWATNDSLIPTNEDEVASDLYDTVQFILKNYPATQAQNWYFSGESYAGKYIPALTHWTLKFNENPTEGDLRVPLAGMIVGDGLTIPVLQRPGEYEEAIAVSLLTNNQLVQARALGAQCQNMVGRNESQDTEIMTNTNTKCNSVPQYISSMSGNVLPFDIRYVKKSYGDIDTTVHKDWIRDNSNVREALHVRTSLKRPMYQSGKASVRALLHDTMYVNSLKYIDYVAARIPTLIFEGNMDMQDGSTSALHWLNMLAAPYGNGGITSRNKRVWYNHQANGTNATVGWIQQTDNVTFLTIAFAGHFVPFYQPAHSTLMVDAFTSANHEICGFNNSFCVDTAPAMCRFMNNCSGHGTCNSSGLCHCEAGYGLADCSAAHESIVNGNKYQLNEGSWAYYTIHLSETGTFINFIEDNGTANVNVYISYTQTVTDINYDVAYIAQGSQSSYGRKIFLPQQDGRTTAYVTVHNPNYFQKANYTLTTTGRNNGDSSSGTATSIMWILIGAGITVVIAGVVIIVLLKSKPTEPALPESSYDTVSLVKL